MRVYKGRIFIQRKAGNGRGGRGGAVYKLPLLENRETNGETGNICQTHIFSDLSRPCFLKNQFNFPAVVKLSPDFRREDALVPATS